MLLIIYFLTTFVPEMKKISIILLLLIAFAKVDGQVLGPNLINNPSFEDYYSCPTFSTQLYLCKYWWGYSTEYYNTCATISSNASVPLNGAGFQNAHKGDAYTGACFYNNTNLIYDYRERMKTKLSDSLIKNKRYCTNLYISLAEFTYNSFFTNNIVLDSVGLLFTKDSVPDNDTAFSCKGIKIQNNIFNIDTINWRRKSNSFIANGGEKYLTIGNFDNNINWSNSAIYVYIDDVSVCECSFEFNLGKDTTLCDGETIILNPNMPNAIYTWQDSSHTSTYTVTKPGIYWLRAYFPDYGITTSDTIEIIKCNSINIPNAFTPNADGKNDVFKIETIKEIIDFKLIIYNRWGELIYESTDINKGWDGTYKGKTVPQGVYVYILTGIIKDTGEQIKRTGSVTLLR